MKKNFRFLYIDIVGNKLKIKYLLNLLEGVYSEGYLGFLNRLLNEYKVVK